ncbi:MAG: hypothetical protein KatS3mg084_0085 [Candidatus Dojkabacteria bacterium]|nr:MAG: hypothetical protein KatS3mg084_0085 [Candidatus Dojkabacteria bacterium]
MKTNNTKNTDGDEDLLTEQDDHLSSAVHGIETDNFDTTFLDSNTEELPIEQLLKEPLQDDLESDTEEEYAAWCPVCNDYTIFVDGTCTGCGFTKNTRKEQNQDEENEGDEGLFDTFAPHQGEGIVDLDLYNYNDDFYTEDGE